MPAEGTKPTEANNQRYGGDRLVATACLVEYLWVCRALLMFKTAMPQTGNPLFEARPSDEPGLLTLQKVCLAHLLGVVHATAWFAG